MDLDQAREFVRGQRWAVLATRRHDGRPQLSPVLCSVDDEGRIVISSRETAAKTRNSRRDPEVSICVLSEGFFGEWVEIDGRAEVVALPTAMDHLVDYYRRLSGEHPDWEEYRAAMEREHRVAVLITPERAGPDRSG